MNLILFWEYNCYSQCVVVQTKTVKLAEENYQFWSLFLCEMVRIHSHNLWFLSISFEDIKIRRGCVRWLTPVIPVLGRLLEPGSLSYSELLWYHCTRLGDRDRLCLKTKIEKVRRLGQMYSYVSSQHYS